MTQTEIPTQSTALAIASPDSLAAYPARVTASVDIIAEALAMEAQTASGVSPFDLSRIKMPTGGGTSWEVPTPAGEESMKTFEAIILDWRETRVFWTGTIDETGGGQPPDCSSEDGIHGSGLYGVQSEGNRSGLCQNCPMAQWGSRKGGRGQACRSVRQVAVMRPGELLPALIFLPPSSLKPFKRYVLSLASRALSPFQVVTSFGLVKATGGTVPYSQVAPVMASAIPPDEQPWIVNYREKLLPAFKHAAKGAFIDDDSDED